MNYLSKIPALSAALFLLASAHAFAGDIERMSDDGFGNEGNRYSYTFHSGVNHFSADGRYVTYYSAATNLVTPDANGSNYDVYVYDRDTGINERISVASDGTQGNYHSYDPSISADGRYVAFYSYATNLVTPDHNGSRADIYVHDRETGVTERVSVASDGTQGNYDSYRPSISADGRYVAFDSRAWSLVIPDHNGTRNDIYIHDRDTGATERVSVASDGTQGNYYSHFSSISADGRYVAFRSNATNLVFPDHNGLRNDVYVHDRDTGVTERVSVASDGTQGNYDSDHPSISADGRYVAFDSRAWNLITPDANGSSADIYVHDRDTGATERVSVASDGTQGNYHSWYPSISAYGRYVAFLSLARNLVTPDTNGSETDIYVHDRTSGNTIRVNTASDGTQANFSSLYAAISLDGTLVAFSSYATNLVLTGISNYGLQAFIKETDLDPSGSNNAPLAHANGPYTVDEGDMETLDGSASSDPDGDPISYEWDFDYDGITFDVDAFGSAIPSFSAAALDGPGTVTVAVRVTDDKGASDIDDAEVNVNNVAPEVGAITAVNDPVPIGTEITASASFTDAGTPDTHTATWDWDNSSSAGTVTQNAGDGSVLDSHTYNVPGIYTLELAVMDDDTGTDSVVYQYVVVYDPDGSFVTGGGKIDSPTGAYLLDPASTGMANFGFVSKYKKGADIPTGHTEFQFHAAGLDFKSTDYQWLVVAGARAQFKGTGTIKDVPGSFGFFLTAIDGEVNGGGGSDKFRIKIWDANDDSFVIYDNQVGAADDADPTTDIQTGSIVIHSKGKK